MSEPETIVISLRSGVYRHTRREPHREIEPYTHRAPLPDCVTWLPAEVCACGQYQLVSDPATPHPTRLEAWAQQQRAGP